MSGRHPASMGGGGLPQTGPAHILAPGLPARRPRASMKTPNSRDSPGSANPHRRPEISRITGFRGRGIGCAALFNCLHSVPQVDLTGRMRSSSSVTGMMHPGPATAESVPPHKDVSCAAGPGPALSLHLGCRAPLASLTCPGVVSPLFPFSHSPPGPQSEP